MADIQSTFYPYQQKSRLGLCWYYVISEMSPNIMSNPETSNFSVHVESRIAGQTSEPIKTVCGRGFCLHQGVKAWLISKAPADRCGTKKIWSYWLPMHSYKILEATYTSLFNEIYFICVKFIGQITVNSVNWIKRFTKIQLKPLAFSKFLPQTKEHRTF